MSVYKIFPSQDATIYSEFPITNTGLDEILELSSTSDGNVSRILIQFDQTQLQQLQSLSSGSSYDAYLKLYITDATSLPLNYTLQFKSLSQSWDMGTGKLYDNPTTTNGVTWQANTINTNWNNSGSDFVNSNCSQSFTNNDVKDIEVNITEIFNTWLSGSNNGLVIKYEDNLEFQSSSSIDLKFFSVDTHTIYPPCLELRWDNSQYSSSLQPITSSNCVVSFANAQNKYQQDSVQRFRVNCREKYPARTFTTSSIYLNNQILPSSSLWSIRDYDTKEIIIDFDSNYTKLSCDNIGNYFDIYMNGLEPERSYCIFIKSTIDNSTIVFEDLAYFKVIK